MGKLDEVFKFIFRKLVFLEFLYYLKLLELCIEVRVEKYGYLVYKCLLFNGFYLNLILNIKLIIFYGKFGDMSVVCKVFDRMFEWSIVLWIVLLFGYSYNGVFKDVLLVF